MDTDKQSTRLNCIIYQEEHNSTILLTYEAQLAMPRTVLDQTTTVTLGAPRINEALLCKTLGDNANPIRVATK